MNFFLSDFSQRFCRKNADVPDINFTLLDATGIPPTLILNQNVTAGERKLGPLQNLNIRTCKVPYTQGVAAFGSVRNLVKASNLSVSNTSQFLHSKPFYKKT